MVVSRQGFLTTETRKTSSVRLVKSGLSLRNIERIGCRLETARCDGQSCLLFCKYVHYIPGSYASVRYTGSRHSLARTRNRWGLWDSQNDGILRTFRWFRYGVGPVFSRRRFYVVSLPGKSLPGGVVNEWCRYQLSVLRRGCSLYPWSEFVESPSYSPTDRNIGFPRAGFVGTAGTGR